MCAMPLTTGQLRTNIADMEIGDYIKMNFYTGYGTTGTASLIGFGERTNANYVEGSLTGEVNRNNKDIFSYFIKVDKGLLISDRIIVNTVSWDILNSSNYIQGKKFENGIMRSLTGGVAYSDENGNKSATNQGKGAFPTNNEYDRYVLGFPENLIQSGMTVRQVFNTQGYTLLQDTPINSIGANTLRAIRGDINQTFFLASNSSDTSYGFRPVFAYNES